MFRVVREEMNVNEYKWQSTEQFWYEPELYNSDTMFGNVGIAKCDYINNSGK